MRYLYPITKKSKELLFLSFLAICQEEVVVILSDKVEGPGDWNSLKFQDTTYSEKNKETKGMVFYQMETEEVSDRFVAPCFVNGLEAYDVRKGNKVVKKELIVALRGEIYFVKFFINPEEDDVENGVIFETEGKEKSNHDWDHLLDFNIIDVPLLGEEGLPPFVCRMGKNSRNKKRGMENVNFFYQDVGTSSSVGGRVRWKDCKRRRRISKRIKGEALKEKDDHGAFIFPIRLEGQVNKNALADTGSDINTIPYRIYETLGREDMKKVDRGITMINHTQAKAIVILSNVLCQVGVTNLITKFSILDILINCDSSIVVGQGFLHTFGGIVNTPERLFLTFDGFCHQTFRAARFDIMRKAESDSDDEEDYQIKRNKFGAPIFKPNLEITKPAPYLKCNDPDESSLALQTVTNPLRKINVWNKAVSFLDSLPVPLKNVNWKPDYKGSYTKEEEATGQ
nr:reverse transcriptase domain-containing protein [Tanacetum cinerariifolium]